MSDQSYWMTVIVHSPYGIHVNHSGIRWTLESAHGKWNNLCFCCILSDATATVIFMEIIWLHL